MPSVTARAHTILPGFMVLAVAVTAFFQISRGIIEFDYDPDATITELCILTVTVFTFISIIKYQNFRLETGLALIIYAMAVHLVEEFTVEFSFLETAVLSCILVLGFVLVITGILQSRNNLDLMIENLKQQETELRARSEELVTMSNALEQANKKLRLLTQITRHDINNSILAARCFVALAGLSDTPGKTSEYLKKTDESLATISGMIGFTRIYEEIGVALPEWLEVHPLVDVAIQPRLREGVSIINAIDPHLAIFADKMVEKVFCNLIDNAHSYGGETLTRIAFSSRAQDGMAIITCEDNGCGIPLDDKERIFERGVGKNTGLGLFLSAEILSITGMTIRETGTECTGARFEILVPKGKHQTSARFTDS